MNIKHLKKPIGFSIKPCLDGYVPCLESLIQEDSSDA